MKTFKLIILALFIITGANAQVLSPKAKAKAEKKAKAEAKMYQKKGFKSANSSLSLYDLLVSYYQHSLLEISNHNRVYISSQSKATKMTQKEALEEATQKAKNRIPSLMAMYFNSWVSVDERTSLKEKSKITKAINKVNKNFNKQLQNLKPDFTYQLIRSKNNKLNAHVRILYDQKKTRNIYKSLIIQYLVENKDFDSKEIKALLTFKSK